MEYQFCVPGAPHGKDRPRAGLIHGRIVMYTPKKTKDYEKSVREAFVKAYPDSIPLDGPVCVVIEACFQIPKSERKAVAEKCVSGELLPTKKCDADNIAKAVLDAVNGLAYRDDAQVVHLDVHKRYVSNVGDSPSVAVTVYAMEGLLHEPW